MRPKADFDVFLDILLQQDAPLLPVRKPLQPENKKHIDDDDNCSIASSYPFPTSIIEYLIHMYVCMYVRDA